jgi:hypothetical protein
VARVIGGIAVAGVTSVSISALKGNVTIKAKTVRKAVLKAVL